MEQDRGRNADAPWQIPVGGWADILHRAWKGTAERNLSLVAGGVTYYLLLAVFPGLAALVSVYGLVANPSDVGMSVQSLSGMLPPSTVKLVSDELTQLASASSQSLGLGAVIGIAIALWSGVRGMTGMMTALNIAYDQPEQRGFIRIQRDCPGADRRGGYRWIDHLRACRRPARSPEPKRCPRIGTLDRSDRRMAVPDRVRDGNGGIDLPLRARPAQAEVEMDLPRRDRGHNPMGPRIGPIQCIYLPLWQLQQDLRFVGPAVDFADLDVAVGVRRHVWSRDQRRGRAADPSEHRGSPNVIGIPTGLGGCPDNRPPSADY